MMKYSLPALLNRSFDDSAAFHEFRDGEWVSSSWRALTEDVTCVASALMKRQLPRGSRVALLGSGSGWMKVYLGAQVAGIIPVGIYDSSSAEEVKQLVEDSGSSILFVSSALLRPFDVGVPVILLDDASPSSSGLSWSSFLKGVTTDVEAVRQSAALVQGSDAAVIIYTSGTTGVSKGVVLTFRNIDTFLVSRACSIHSAQTRAVSFLPLAHLAGQGWTIWILVAFGGQVWFSRGLPFLVNDLRVARPTTFFAPPRVYEGWFREYEARENPSGIKAELGLEQCADMICAAAPFDAKILAWFHKTGFFVREVYGLSEVPIATSSAGIDFKVGSAGKAETEVRNFLASWASLLTFLNPDFDCFER